MKSDATLSVSRRWSFPSFPYPFQNRIKLLTWSDKHWLRYLVQKLRNRVVFFIPALANNSPTYLAALRFYAAIFPHLKRLRFGGIYADIFASQFIELICVRYGEKRDALRSLPWCQTFFACDPALQIRFGNRFDLYIKLFVPLDVRFQATDIKPQGKFENGNVSRRKGMEGWWLF